MEWYHRSHTDMTADLDAIMRETDKELAELMSSYSLRL